MFGQGHGIRRKNWRDYRRLRSARKLGDVRACRKRYSNFPFMPRFLIVLFKPFPDFCCRDAHDGVSRSIVVWIPAEHFYTDNAFLDEIGVSFEGPGGDEPQEAGVTLAGDEVLVGKDALQFFTHRRLVGFSKHCVMRGSGRYESPHREQTTEHWRDITERLFRLSIPTRGEWWAVCILPRVLWRRQF